MFALHPASERIMRIKPPKPKSKIAFENLRLPIDFPFYKMRVGQSFRMNKNETGLNDIKRMKWFVAKYNRMYFVYFAYIDRYGDFEIARIA